MADSEGAGEPTTLAPDEAFTILGDETRMAILQALGEANGPVSFTELREAVGIRQGAQFNYHLDKLVGHFVDKTDEGYLLHQTGTRVIEAVLSGAVTDAVIIEPTIVDAPCPYCGEKIEVQYREERLLIRCTECVGSFGNIESTSPAIQALPDGTLTLSYLPSAGVQGRGIADVLRTSQAWSYHQHVLIANDICPRCSGPIDHAVDLCPNHDMETEICGTCQTRWAVLHEDRCTNCGYVHRGGFSHHLLGDKRVRAFFESRGIDPITPAFEDVGPIYEYREEVHSTDPFEAAFTFSVDEDRLVVTVDDALNVVDVSEG